MALLLTFRLNVCYNRWWEGRQLWGVAVTSSRTILMRLLALGGEEAFQQYNAEGERRRASNPPILTSLPSRHLDAPRRAANRHLDLPPNPVPRHVLPRLAVALSAVLSAAPC